ncbi:MAG: hypothetical protein ACLT29_02505 [Ruminococcus callidus]
MFCRRFSCRRSRGSGQSVQKLCVFCLPACNILGKDAEIGIHQHCNGKQIKDAVCRTACWKKWRPAGKTNTPKGGQGYRSRRICHAWCISLSLKLDKGKTSFCKNRVVKSVFHIIPHSCRNEKRIFQIFMQFSEKAVQCLYGADVKKADEAFYRSKAAFSKNIRNAS